MTSSANIATERTPHRNLLPFHWGLIILLWMLYIPMVLYLYTNQVGGGVDFDFYYRAAVRLIEGVPFYDNVVSGIDYVGPSMLVQFLTPLALFLDYDGVKLVWFILNILLLWGTIFYLTRFLEKPSHKLILWLLPIFSTTTLVSIWSGQSTIILLACTVGAWGAYRNQRPIWTGILLAIPTWIKFYPGLIILYFLWKREWRVTASAFIAGMVILAFQIAGVSLEQFIFYVTEVLPNLTLGGEDFAIWGTQSLLAFNQKLFTQQARVIPLIESDLLFNIFRPLTTLSLLGATVFLTLKPSRLSDTADQQYDFEYAMVMMAALLLGATLHLPGMISLLLVVTIFLMHWSHIKSQFSIFLYLILAWLLIELHFFIILGYRSMTGEESTPALLLLMAFYGMMILLFRTMNILGKLRKGQTSL